MFLASVLLRKDKKGNAIAMTGTYMTLDLNLVP